MRFNGNLKFWNGLQERNKTKRWKNLSGEDRKVDGNELVSYHFPPFTLKDSRQKNKIKNHQDSEYEQKLGRG